MECEIRLNLLKMRKIDIVKLVRILVCWRLKGCWIEEWCYILKLFRMLIVM